MSIRSFKDRETERVYNGEKSKRWSSIAKIAKRKLHMLDVAITLLDLASPPGNRLHALSKDRAGQHSISVNDQFRICFRWTNAGPADVEIADYH